MSQITTHVLDTSRGKPGNEISVSLLQQQAEDWRQVGLATTDEHGRCNSLLKKDVVLEAGVYRLRIDVKNYFDREGLPCFYPFIEITFTITGPEHYHIPVLISSFGFTTYRGT